MEILCKMFRQKCRYFSLSEIQIDEKIFKMRIQLCPTKPLREEGYHNFPISGFLQTCIYIMSVCLQNNCLTKDACMCTYANIYVSIEHKTGGQMKEEILLKDI
jgi:hypothetical protein